MPRARAADNTKAKAKAILIEDVTLGIREFQEILTAIDDFSSEGFPYRDAARAKAELQLRECVRRIFGERSSEFQTFRNYKLNISNKTQIQQSIAVVKELMSALENKKLELQGLKPPAIIEPPSPVGLPAPPQMRLVPPTAQVTGSVPRPTTSGPSATASQSIQPVRETQTTAPLPVSQPPQAPIAPSPAITASQAIAAVTQSVPRPQQTPTTPVTTPAQAPPSAASPATPTVQTQQEPVAATPPPSPPAPPVPLQSMVVQPTVAMRSVPPAPAPKSAPDQPSPIRTTVEQQIQIYSEHDPLQLIRKVCTRFHSVARQLRLRKDARPTIAVEDDYDLQDLLYGLMKVEFDEVWADEWTPPYTGGASRTTLLIHEDHIAVVAKKTRPGVTTKELADQVAVDAAHYKNREKCSTLFCFIYDPEGRVGSPRQLETHLTSVSDTFIIEVLVAPK